MKTLTGIVLLLLCLPVLAQAPEVGISWTAATGELDGYRIFWRADEGTWSDSQSYYFPLCDGVLDPQNECVDPAFPVADVLLPPENQFDTLVWYAVKAIRGDQRSANYSGEMVVDAAWEYHLYRTQPPPPDSTGRVDVLVQVDCHDENATVVENIGVRLHEDGSTCICENCP